MSIHCAADMRLISGKFLSVPYIDKGLYDIMQKILGLCLYWRGFARCSQSADRK